jgi:hypothetical protein
MKPFIAIAVFLVAVAGIAEDDSPLVKAAKASGGPKKKTTKKVITNDDLLKPTNKAATPAPASKPVVTPAPAVAPPAAASIGSIAEQDKLRHDRAAAQRRIDTAQAKVNDLDKELDRLEQAYYAENDPNYRDKMITERFEQARKQRDTARKELADARDALENLK